METPPFRVWEEVILLFLRAPMGLFGWFQKKKYDPKRDILKELREQFSEFYHLVELWNRTTDNLSENSPQSISGLLHSLIGLKVENRVKNSLKELILLDSPDERVKEIQDYCKDLIPIARYIPKAISRLKSLIEHNQWMIELGNDRELTLRQSRASKFAFRRIVALSFHGRPRTLKHRKINGKPLEEVLQRVHDLLWSIERSPQHLRLNEIDLKQPNLLIHFTHSNWSINEMKLFVQRGIQCKKDVLKFSKRYREESGGFGPSFSPSHISFFCGDFSHIQNYGGYRKERVGFVLKPHWIRDYHQQFLTTKRECAQYFGFIWVPINPNSPESWTWLENEVRINRNIPYEAIAAIVCQRGKAQSVIMHFMSELVRYHPDKIIPIYDHHGKRVWP